MKKDGRRDESRFVSWFIVHPSSFILHPSSFRGTEVARMPQIFHRSFNTISRVSIAAAVAILVVLGWAFYVVGWSPYVTRADVALVQPVPFSHQHHVPQLA